MVIYTIVLACLLVTLVFASDTPKTALFGLLIYMPIFGRIFGWW